MNTTTIILIGLGLYLFRDKIFPGKTDTPYPKNATGGEKTSELPEEERKDKAADLVDTITNGVKGVLGIFDAFM